MRLNKEVRTMRFTGPLTLVVALTLAVPAIAAAPCKDAKGKFMKCPPPAAAAARCRTAKGAFAKCGTPGAKPA